MEAAPRGIRRLPVPADAYYEHVYTFCTPLVLVGPRAALRSRERLEGLKSSEQCWCQSWNLSFCRARGEAADPARD